MFRMLEARSHLCTTTLAMRYVEQIKIAWWESDTGHRTQSYSERGGCSV